MDTISQKIAAIIEELGNIAPIYNETLELEFKEYLANASIEQLTETLPLVRCKNGFHTYYLHKVKTKLTAPPLTTPRKIILPPKKTVPKFIKPHLHPKKKKQKPRKLWKAGIKKQSELERMVQFSKNQKKAKLYGTGASVTSWPKNFPEGLIRIEQGGKIESNRRKF